MNGKQTTHTHTHQKAEKKTTNPLGISKQWIGFFFYASALCRQMSSRSRKKRALADDGAKQQRQRIPSPPPPPPKIRPNHFQTVKLRPPQMKCWSTNLYSGRYAAIVLDRKMVRHRSVGKFFTFNRIARRFFLARFFARVSSFSAF